MNVMPGAEKLVSVMEHVYNTIPQASVQRHRNLHPTRVIRLWRQAGDLFYSTGPHGPETSLATPNAGTVMERADSGGNGVGR